MIARTKDEFMKDLDNLDPVSGREPKKMVLRAQDQGASEGWTRQLIEIHGVKVTF